MFLNDVIGRQPAAACRRDATIRDLAKSMLSTGSGAIAVVDLDARIEGVVTSDALLAWIAAGAGSADQPIAGLMRESPPAVGSAATITDAVLAIADAGADALAVTADGSSNGRLQRLVTPADIGRGFGDQPIAILRGIRLATTTAELRELNHRARALALQYLTSAPSVDWLARFLSLADKHIVQRLIALTGDGPDAACWCFCGASGRAESLTRHAPQLVLIEDDDAATMHDRFARVSDALAECDYLSRVDGAFERAFPRERRVASRGEWRTWYRDWLRDPVRTEMYLARPLFDLRPVEGRDSLWRDLEATVVAGVDRDLLQVLANDCLASLPPVTFFEDAVVEESGEHLTVFRLEHSALRPLVDVGRVFGLATGKVLGTSTRERLACARRLLPEHESIFRDASDTFRILLWQQARIGIGQGTDGTELPPALLSRHDRHVLKSGFRSILRLIELTGNSAWFQTA
jgi:CBS domain-containing protein